MRFEGVRKLGFNMWLDRVTGKKQNMVTLNLSGPPGIGKTAVGHAIAADMQAWVNANGDLARKVGLTGKAAVEVQDLTSSLPEDLGGVPLPTGKHDDEVGVPILSYALQDWMVRMMRPGAFGVLILDDLPAAMPAIQAAVRKLVLARAVHGHEISPYVFLIVTGNRRQDGAGASTLPSHFRNAVMTVTIDPWLPTWIKWYGAQEGLDPIVPAFLQTVNGLTHFSQLPDKASKDEGAFATPRTWALLGQEFRTAENSGELLSAAHGLVGDSAVEFLAFKEIKSQLVSPERVLLDPQGALPNPERQLDTPDKAVAMVTGIAEHAVAWLKGNDTHRRSIANERFLLALAWTVQGKNGEHVATCVHHFDALGGNPEDLVEVVGKHATNEHVRNLILRLKKLFKNRES